MKSETVKIDIEAESPTQIIASLTSSIDKNLRKFSEDPSIQGAACIFKVSQKLRKANEAAYTPRLVSIGPLHHDLGHLQSMEACKLKFLNNFMSRIGVGLNTLVEFAEGIESFVRGCYDGKVNLSKKKLTEVILLDGVFIVELFLENHLFKLRDRNEKIFENHWRLNDLLHDMLLLENLLPMKVMEGLLEFVDYSFLNAGIKLSIYDLAQKFFKDVGNTQKMSLTKDGRKARHFVEFLLKLHSPVKKSIDNEPKSLPTKFEYTRSATELHQAGVKFISTEGNCFFDIKFETGVLTIPKLTVNDSTETFFRNLIAYEQCGYDSEDITSYVILMDGFINTSHDVDLLVKCGVIKNELGESELVAHLFNNLHKEVVTEANIFYFDKLCEDLNDYSRDRFHEMKASCFNWRVMLRRNYFSNPWSCMSLFAAVLLLILTIIQTVCSILQVV